MDFFDDDPMKLPDVFVIVSFGTFCIRCHGSAKVLRQHWFSTHLHCMYCDNCHGKYNESRFIIEQSKQYAIYSVATVNKAILEKAEP